MTGSGNISVTNNDYLRTNPGITPTLVYWHSGPIWKAEAGIGYSKGTTVVSNFSEGYFFNSLARRTGLTVSFDGITYLRPSTITVTDGATGAPVDPYRLDNYLISSVRSHSLDIQGRKNMVQDTQRSAYANLGREFSWRVPVAVKAGLDVRETIRDLRVGGQSTLNFVGADGRATTTPVNSDDFAGVVLDPLNSQRAPGYGLPPIQWVSNSRLFDLYRTNPTYFRLDEATTYRSNATTSKFADEIISSVYIRGDVHFFDRRLKIVGGVRAEQTNVKAEGPLTDTTRNYQRDANGKVILGSNGSPIPITTDPLGIAKLTVIERGLKINKEYLRLFPSLNSSYTFRDNLIVRGAYYHSVGRPNFNQYAGGVTLPDTEAVNPATQRITVNNAGIKAWSAKTTKVMLEYYFEKVGVVSVSAFRRNFENFFGTAVFRATPEFLSLYGLDPNIYGNYDVSTQYNVPTGVRMEGIDLNYKQSLTMLPYWARGVQVFANVSALRATGPETANFAGYVPRTYNAGFTLSRQKFSLRVNSSYRGRNRSTLVATGRSIAPNTFRWGARQLYLGASAEYALFKRVSVYADFHNDVMLDTEIANPLTPEHAQLSGRQEYGGLWTFGVKSSF
ncbi:MAG TPA: outer membrane beta-barrel protein, partial [Opitutaceae bacterium]|nr:outer membrane beta-barrel protein [Opitutaceae bacterium]